MRRQSVLKILKIALIVTVTAAVTAAVTFLLFRRSVLEGFGGEQGYKTALSYAQARKLISEKFIAEYDEDRLTEASMDALIEALDDRWAYYMTGEEYESYLQSANNEYSGIGVVISADAESGGLLIGSVYADSPAYEAGLMAGQIILSIDGTATAEVETAKELIQAKAGETITVRVLLEDGTESELQVYCGTVYKNPVSFEMLEGGAGYVRISNFDYTACDEFKKAVESLMADGARALVFDVRYNPGGKVSELTDMLDFLLPEGDVFISRDKDGGETRYSSDESCIDIPMAVLVNEHTYSAAEFFGAALREYGAAVIVGSHTTGKGYSQATYQLPDGGAIHLSTRAYFTPKGENLAQAGGVEPDVELDLGDEDAAKLYYGLLERSEDAQLAAALEALAS